MNPSDAFTALSPVVIIVLIIAFLESQRSRREIVRTRKLLEQRVYESLILREVGERIGYELNIEKILESIISSLTNLIPFSVVSYMLLTDDPNKILFRIHLEEMVNRRFIDEIASRMLTELAKVTGKDTSESVLSENISGTIIDENSRDQVTSFWVTPLSINEHGLGVLAVASKKPGLYQGKEMSVLVQILEQANWAVNRLERVLETEKGKLNAMVESVTDGIVMLDQDEKLVVINPAAKKMLGLSSEKINFFDIAKALSDKTDIRTKFEESLSEEKVTNAGSIYLNDSYFQIVISPVKDSGAKTLGGVILFQDISAQKELERVRDDFTAMMVHELRAPLTVVRGTTDMILKNPQMAAEDTGKDLLASMQDSTEAMLTLVNDLLDVAKIEAGK